MRRDAPTFACAFGMHFQDMHVTVLRPRHSSCGIDQREVHA